MSYNNNSSPLLIASGPYQEVASNLGSILEKKKSVLQTELTGVTLGISSPPPNPLKDDSYFSPDYMNSDPAMLLNSIHRSVRIGPRDPDLQKIRSLSSSSYPQTEASAPILDLGSPFQDFGTNDPTSVPDSASSRKRGREGSESSYGFAEDDGQNGSIFLSPFVTQGLQEPLHVSQSSPTVSSVDSAKVEQLVFSATRDARNLFVCPITNCGKTFTFKTNLRRHVTVHTGERRHICMHCSARFSRSDDYAGHIRSQHPQQAHSTLGKNSGANTDGRTRTSRAKREQDTATSSVNPYTNPLLSQLFVPVFGGEIMPTDMGMMSGGFAGIGAPEMTNLLAPAVSSSTGSMEFGMLNSSVDNTQQLQQSGSTTNSSSSASESWGQTLDPEQQSTMLLQAQEIAQQQQLFQAWQMQLRRAEYEQATQNVLRYQIAQQQQEIHAAQLHQTKVPRFNLASPIAASGSLSSPLSLSLSGVPTLLHSPHNPSSELNNAPYSSPSSILAPASFRFSPSSANSSTSNQPAPTTRREDFS